MWCSGSGVVLDVSSPELCLLTYVHTSHNAVHRFRSRLVSDVLSIKRVLTWGRHTVNSYTIEAYYLFCYVCHMMSAFLA